MAVAVWSPLEVYQEMRDDRQATEASRKYDPLMKMDGYIPKGGGRFTPRYATMLDGAKIVPVDGGTAPITTITGEIITDDQTAFIDTSPLTVWPQIDYQPPEAEIIEVQTGGLSEANIATIATAVWGYQSQQSLAEPTVGRAVADVRKLMANKAETVLTNDDGAGSSTIYEDDGTTPFKVFNHTDKYNRDPA